MYWSKFNAEWLKKDKYKNWLKQVDGDEKYAYCTICKVKFDVGNMRMPALDNHGRGVKLIYNLKMHRTS